ncbi:MAG: T9SS type A sorting domain-containing protein, partial [Flavobacteriaceae bacterium]
YDILGKRVSNVFTDPTDTVNMDVSALQSGIYFLKVQNKSGDISSRKIIID